MEEVSFFFNYMTSVLKIPMTPSSSVKSRDEKRKILKEDKVEMEKYLKGRSKPQQQRIVENMQRTFAATTTTVRDKK